MPNIERFEIILGNWKIDGYTLVLALILMAFATFFVVRFIQKAKPRDRKFFFSGVSFFPLLMAVFMATFKLGWTPINAGMFAMVLASSLCFLMLPKDVKGDITKEFTGGSK